jgi:hypothetical protein
MTVYNDYTNDEQQLLRSSLAAAAVAVSAASPGRKEETVSEGFAAASLVLGSGPAYVDNTLVGSVIVDLEARLQHDQPFRNYADLASGPGAEEAAMKTLRSVVSLLDAKATPDESAGYKAWLMTIAQTVAGAGKEDQGFLGRGGVMVNDAERAALGQIAGVLGIES